MNVELRNIHKTFGIVHANDGISLNIPEGTIQGILGENGAGKSTLMKILSGFIQADKGEILLDGKAVKIASPSDAIRYGIGMLYQDPMDFPPMKVVDNLLIGYEKSGFFPNHKAAEQVMEEMCKKFGFKIDHEAYVDTLTVGERQQLEIIRLLWLGARVLILDEPTTGISATQKVKLFETLKLLASQGITVIFVTHKLEDVEVLCSRVVVFRRGKVVGEQKPPFNSDELVTMMFSKAINLSKRNCCAQEAVALQVTDLSIEDYRMRIDKVNLAVKKGEIIGLAGMEGSGQRQFLRTLAGLMRSVEGKILLNGQDLTGKPYHTYLQKGIAFMPAARLEEGLIAGLTLAEHFTLCREEEGLFLNEKKAVKMAEDGIDQFNIRGAPSSRIEALSGGNQQRALLSLLKSPLNLLLLEHPTRGLDVESAIWIWSTLIERCKQGTAILFISSDLDEILQYSDRILVFFGGKVSEPLDASQTSVDQIGQLIGGKGFA